MNRDGATVLLQSPGHHEFLAQHPKLICPFVRDNVDISDVIINEYMKYTEINTEHENMLVVSHQR